LLDVDGDAVDTYFVNESIDLRRSRHSRTKSSYPFIPRFCSIRDTWAPAGVGTSHNLQGPWSKPGRAASPF